MSIAADNKRESKNVCILDSDKKRADEMASNISSRLFSCMTFQKIEELQREYKNTDIILLYDEGDFITKIMHDISAYQRSIALCAYSENVVVPRIVSCIRRGVWDYLTLPTDDSLDDRLLLASTEGVSAKRNEIVRNKIGKGLDKLSPRELDVASLLAAGLSTKEVGERLGISHRTVEVHASNLYGKLEIKGRIDLVMHAAQLERLRD